MYSVSSYVTLPVLEGEQAPCDEGAACASDASATLPAITSFVDAVKSAARTHERVVVLAQTPAEHAMLKHCIAAAAGAACGISVVSLRSWLSSTWDTWGDGRTVITPAARYLALVRVLERVHKAGVVATGANTGTDGDATAAAGADVAREAAAADTSAAAVYNVVYTDVALSNDAPAGALEFAGSHSITPGIVSIMARMMERACAYIPPSTSADTPYVQWVALVAQTYCNYIRTRGFIEPTMLAGELEAVLSPSFSYPAFVVWGDMATCAVSAFDIHTYNWLSTKRSITFVHPYSGEVSLWRARDAWCEPSSDAADAHNEADMFYAYRQHYGLSRELDAVRAAIFTGRVIRDERAGDVDVLHAAASLSVAELIRRKVATLCDEAGCRSITVSCSNPYRMFQNLAPKLYAQRCNVRACVQLPLSRVACVPIILSFMRSVIFLYELQQSWPHATQVDDATFVALGDMSWWPPRELTDFLTCQVAQMNVANAYRLNTMWRQNRLLTPELVLTHLMSKTFVSEPTIQFVRNLVKGRLYAALQQLAGAFENYTPQKDSVPDDHNGTIELGESMRNAFSEELTRVSLSALVQAAQCVTRWHTIDDIRADAAAGADAGTEAGTDAGAAVSPRTKKQSPTPLQVCALMRHQFDLLEKLTCEQSVHCVPQLSCSNARATVQLCTITQAAQAPAQSVDAVIIADSTSAQSPITTNEQQDVRTLNELHIECMPEPLVTARYAFLRLLHTARTHVSVERELLMSDASTMYPSVMTIDLLACYGLENDKPKDKSKDDKPKDDTPRPLPTYALSEKDVLSCIDAALYDGASTRQVTEEDIDYAGHLAQENYPLLNMHSQGSMVPQHEFILSASQIEEYLHCPYSWFYSRHIPPARIDAEFSFPETGTFVHGILETLHRTLYEDAVPAQVFTKTSTPASMPYYSAAARITEDTLASVQTLFETLWQQRLDMQYRKRSGKELMRSQAYIPHTVQDKRLLDEVHDNVRGFLKFEAERLCGFSPTFFEWRFGKGDGLVRYAGMYVGGSIDRVDIDEKGRVLIIDYKYKNPNKLDDYVPLSPAAATVIQETLQVSDIDLPRYVQTLMYAQIIRRSYANCCLANGSPITIAGALYVSAQRSSSRDYTIRGAILEDFEARVFGDSALMAHDTTCARMVVPKDLYYEKTGAYGMNALLDYVEDCIEQRMSALVEGTIAPAEISLKHQKDCRVCASAASIGRVLYCTPSPTLQ